MNNFKSKISDISVENIKTFNNNFISFDIDWAHDDVINYSIDILEKTEIRVSWFITHKTGGNRSFLHYFVIFDLDMNLLRVSEAFKFENYTREYCICFYIENDNIFIGYSTNDNTSVLNIYNKQDLLENIKFDYTL